MTEFEINKAVAKKAGIKNLVKYDPCNNAQQAWKIMLANDIAIMREGDYFYVLYNVYHCGNGVHRAKRVSHRNEKPFVAAMLLFLEI